MALQFDVNGTVQIPSISASGNFFIKLDSFITPSTTQSIGGSASGSQNGFTWVTGSGWRIRINSVNFDFFNIPVAAVGVDAGVTLIRTDGSDLTLTTPMGTQTITNASSATLVLDQISGFNNGANKLDTLLGGFFEVSGGTVSSPRKYDFEQMAGTQSLPDLLSGQDGSLVGFTTGGFVGGGSDSISLNVSNNYCIQSVGGSRTFNVGGNYVGSPNAIEWSDDGVNWVVGEPSPQGNAYSFPITLPNGQYTISVRFDDGSVSAMSTNVTIGDGILACGQSNMMGYGSNNQDYTPNSYVTSMLGNDDVFKDLADPYDSNSNQIDAISSDSAAAGSWMLRFVNYWSSTKDSPIFIIPCPRSGSSISEWQKTSTDRVGGLNLYESAIRRATITGGVKYVFWEQGERDSMLETLNATYESLLNTLINDFKSDLNAETIIIPLHTISASGYDGNGTTTGQDAIRQSQFNVAASNANAKITPLLTDIDLSGGDGLHFQTNVELDTVGQRVASFFTSSNLVITVPSIGNQTRDFDFYNHDLKTFINTHSVTFTNDEADISLPVSTGTVVVGHNITADPLADGVPIYGVTVDV